MRCPFDQWGIPEKQILAPEEGFCPPQHPHLLRIYGQKEDHSSVCKSHINNAESREKINTAHTLGRKTNKSSVCGKINREAFLFFISGLLHSRETLNQTRRGKLPPNYTANQGVYCLSKHHATGSGC